MKMFGTKKRVALALGSGGAKGMAHVGVLKALEERGFSFCAVAGTSIGSIVGALYAKGYSATDIGELLKAIDMKSLAFAVLAAGSVAPVKDALDRILDESDFSELALPFAAVATDAESGEEVVLRSGNVAEAVLASSAMPPFFRNVAIGDKMLMDGAFSNAVPGDVARKLGADFVIGVSLSPAERYVRGSAAAEPQRGILSCDILLEPDLTAYAPTDVTASAAMYEIGYECVADRFNEITAAMRAHHIKL